VTTDNRDIQANNFGQFSIVAPTDSRLPGGGGQTISGLYNVNPNVVNRSGATVANTSANDAYNTLSSTYGSQTSIYNGVLLNVSARVRNGLTFQGGMNTGKTVTDQCDIPAGRSLARGSVSTCRRRRTRSLIPSIHICSSSLRRPSFGKLPGFLRSGCSKSSISLTGMRIDGRRSSIAER